MIRRVIVSLAVMALLAFSFLAGDSSPGSVSAGHLNDSFSTAIAISAPLPYSDSHKTVDSTLEVAEPQPCAGIDNTVWYSYTPAATVTLTAHTAGSRFDTVLAVYTGGTLATLVSVGCDDNGGPGSTSEVTFNANAGVTYYFQIGGTGGIFNDDGGYTFSLHEPPAKGNDDLALAVVISGPLPYSNKGDAGGATFEPSEPRPCAGIDNTVWFSYTPSSDVILAADTEGSLYDTALAVYAGSVDPADLVGCDDNAGTFVGDPISGNILYGHARLAFKAFAGETYLFQVGGAFETRGHLTFNLAAELPPAKGNDDFANALQILEPLPFVNTQDTSGATTEVGEPSPCSPLASSIWYSFTPSTDVILDATTSATFASTFRIYQGADLTSLTTIGCRILFPSEPVTSFIASAGVPYHFQVGGCTSVGCFGSVGSVTFTLTSSPCPLAGCVEMAMSIPGGDCDKSLVPTECDVPVGEQFNLSIDVVTAPVDGYIHGQTFVYFGGDLVYKPTARAIEEILWPDCDPAIALRSQGDQTLPVGDRASNEVVGHGCLTELPSLPKSSYVGEFVAILLTCSEEATRTEVKLLRRGHPVARTNGALFTLPDMFASVVAPKVNHLIVNCVAPAAATVTPTPPPFPKMSKLPVLQNVWLTRQSDKIPPVDCLAGTDIGRLAEILSQAIGSPDPKESGTFQQLAAFEFEVHYDNTKVCVAISAGTEFEAAEAVCIIEDSDSKPQLEGVARIGCVTIGKGHNIDELVLLAQVNVYPQPELYSQIKPNQNNGVVVQINNVNCDLSDEQGHAIPIFSCDDADITFRYLEGDVDPDCSVDVVDAQAVAFRWGVAKGSLLYHDFLNVEPSGTQADDDIDINDLQFIFGRIGSTCDDPHPPQPPVNPKAGAPNPTPAPANTPTSTQTPTSSPTPTACPSQVCPPPEMVLNVEGGICDDAVRPTTCTVALGAKFTLSVDAVAIPAGGYILAQTWIEFGSDLVYKPAPTVNDEIVWPDCALFAYVIQLTPQSVHHSCATAVQETFLLSNHTGFLVQLSLTCSATNGTTKIRILPDGDSVARTNGALFVDSDQTRSVPILNPLTINCGS